MHRQRRLRRLFPGELRAGRYGESHPPSSCRGRAAPFILEPPVIFLSNTACQSRERWCHSTSASGPGGTQRIEANGVFVPPTRRRPSAIQTLNDRFTHLQAWIEQHPWPAWIIATVAVLAIIGTEVSFWPRNDYPHAMWHNTPRGDDIELAQAAAAKADWRELLGYWFGRTIQGHGYYRPLTSWLFVAEYRLWGTDDRTWAWLNIALHLAVVVSLLWAAWAILVGSQSRRLMVGSLAALLFGAPGLADRTVQSWILSWWPCQSEHLSLLAGLVLLGATAQYARNGQIRWAAIAALTFALAVFFKEMGYVAGLGACLLLLRHPRARGLLAILAAEGVLLFALRWAALQHAGGAANSPPTERQSSMFWLSLAAVEQRFEQASLQFAILGAGIAIALILPLLVRSRRITLRERIAFGGVSYAVGAMLIIGLPWEKLFQSSLEALSFWLWRGAILAGLAPAFREWPVPELILIWLLSLLTISGFSPTFGWYQYWGSLFGALVSAIGATTLCLLAWNLLVNAPTKSLEGAGSPVPRRQ